MNKDDQFVKEIFNSIQTPEYDIRSAISAAIANNTSRPRFRLKKTAAALIVASAVLLLTVAAAASLTSFGQLAGLLSQEKSNALSPVQMSCESNGIKVEVVAVSRYENTVRAYIALQDLEGKGRLSKSSNFKDYYSLRAIGAAGQPDPPHGGVVAEAFGSSSYQAIDYNADSQTAVFEMEFNSESGFHGENLMFSTSKIFLGEKHYCPQIDLGVFKNVGETLPIPYYFDMPDYSGDVFVVSASIWDSQSKWPELLQTYAPDHALKILEPKKLGLAIPESRTLQISNAGIVDGRLHVQVFHDEREADAESTPSIYFKGAHGEDTPPAISFNMFVDESGALKKATEPPFEYRLQEYIFGQDPVELSGCPFFADFNAYEYLVGDWQVTFAAEAYDGKTIKKECSVESGGFVITGVTVNPLNIIILRSATVDLDQSAQPRIAIELASGNIEALLRSSGGDGQQCTDIYGMDAPVDVESVKAVVVGGARLEF